MDFIRFQIAILSAVIAICLAQTNTTDSCNDFRLEFGQNYFSIQAYPAKRINSTLRGSGGIYKGELKQNVDIVISVPVPTEGIQIGKLCLFSKNVQTLECTVEHERIEVQLRDGRTLTLWGDMIQAMKAFPASRLWHRSCFHPVGDISTIYLRFLRGRQLRVQIQKLYIEGCPGNK